MRVDLASVRGNELSVDEARERRRDALARVVLDSMPHFVALTDASGNVLDVNKVALDAAGLALPEIEGQPCWTTFWWQVSDEARETLRRQVGRAAAGETVRWDTPMFG